MQPSRKGDRSRSVHFIWVTLGVLTITNGTLTDLHSVEPDVPPLLLCSGTTYQIYALPALSFSPHSSPSSVPSAVLSPCPVGLFPHLLAACSPQEARLERLQRCRHP